MKSIIIIPARYKSQRFPGKPLQHLKGSTGLSRSLVERSWRAAMAVNNVDAVYIATDDERIKSTAEAFGAQVIMTPETCANGTERCAAAIEPLGLSQDDIVINLQGDAPLTPPEFVDALIAQMREAPNCKVTTPVLRCDLHAWQNFTQDRKRGDVGGTTAVFDIHMNALYFSKEVIPFTKSDFSLEDNLPVFHHVGLYGYRAGLLIDYPSWPIGPLEHHEGLEQLRFLEQGHPIKCVQVEPNGRVFWELNNPIDVDRIEEALKRDGWE